MIWFVIDHNIRVGKKIMAKGYQKNKERKEKVALLGKTLVRRAQKKCELCRVQGQSMQVTEVPPEPSIPDPDHAILVCDTCSDAMKTDKPDANALRFLESVIWSDIPVVQVTAVRICRTLAGNGVDWAKDLLDTVYLSAETEAWLG